MHAIEPVENNRELGTYRVRGSRSRSAHECHRA
jgi:hypothetical protein